MSMYHLLNLHLLLHHYCHYYRYHYYYCCHHCYHYFLRLCSHYYHCYCYYHCCHKRLKLKLTKIRLLLQTIISWTIIFPLIICHASLSSSSSYKRHATCRLGLTSFNCGTISLHFGIEIGHLV